jgi:hypothetical protein
MLRLRPELREQAVVVMEGVAPLEEACSLNARARRMGVVRGMTRVELDTISPAAADSVANGTADSGVRTPAARRMPWNV